MKSRAPRAVADMLVSAVPQLADRLPEYRIQRAWSRLVGADVARRARPHELVNGCLHVVVDNSPWLHELTLRAPELTARLREEFEAVRSLRLTLGPVEAEARPARTRAERRPASLSADDLRAIDEAASAIPDSAAAAAARRLLTKAWRWPAPQGGEQ